MKIYSCWCLSTAYGCTTNWHKHFNTLCVFKENILNESGIVRFPAIIFPSWQFEVLPNLIWNSHMLNHFRFYVAKDYTTFVSVPLFTIIRFKHFFHERLYNNLLTGWCKQKERSDLCDWEQHTTPLSSTRVERTLSLASKSISEQTMQGRRWQLRHPPAVCQWCNPLIEDVSKFKVSCEIMASGKIWWI